MKIQKFVIGYVLALALLLFAQQRPATTQAAGFRSVADLAHSLSTNGLETGHRSGYRVQTSVALSEKIYASGTSSSEQFSTRIGTPSHAWGAAKWAVDQIPAGRLIGPLVVLDVSASVKSNPDYELSVEDIARWEQANGEIPVGRGGHGSRGLGSALELGQQLPQYRR